jgi:hypothetical protein
MKTIALLMLLATQAPAQTAAPTQKESIESLASQCGRHALQAGRMQRTLSDLASRARRAEPGVGLDITAFVDEIERFADRMRQTHAASKALLAAAKPDADSVEAAKILHGQADSLRAAAHLLLNEIHWDEDYLRRARYRIEADLIKRDAHASFDASRDILSVSAEIDRKVQPLP